MSEFDHTPTTPADASLYVLAWMRTHKIPVKIEFAAFIAGSVAYALQLAGSDFSDRDVARAVESHQARSPRLFNSEPQASYIDQRTHKPEPHTPKPRRPLPHWKRKN
jgi:hypothetical protein